MQLLPWFLLLGYIYGKVKTEPKEREEPVQGLDLTPTYGYRNKVHGPLVPNQPPGTIVKASEEVLTGNSDPEIQGRQDAREPEEAKTNETLTKTRQEKKLYFNGLDCRSPTSVRNGLVTDICKEPDVTELLGTTETVVILQQATKRTAKAYRCRKKISRLLEVCGAFSHSKILGPPDILNPIPFSALDCQQTIKQGIYRTETGTNINIDTNQSYNYKFIQHGRIQASTTNVACEGASIVINGEKHESVVSLVTVHLEFMEIEVELGNGLARDLDWKVDLPIECARRNRCEDGTTAYVIQHPLQACPLFLVRTIRMKKVPIRTDKGDQYAFISRKHKLLFIIKPNEATDNKCNPLRSVGGTQYPDLKILHADNTPEAEMVKVISKLGPSQLDLSLETITADEYLDYDLEQRMKQQLRTVGNSLCTMSRQALHQTELSPFHKDSLIRIRGDMVSELQCEKVTVEARLGDNRGPHCYKDSLPVWVRNKPLYMLAVSGLIVEENTLTHVPCHSQFNSIFRARNGDMVQADPEVQRVEGLQLQHIGAGYIHAFDTEEPTHSEFSSDLLYNNEQVGAFNDLIHFNRARAHVLDSLVRQYCKKSINSKFPCGEYRPEGPGNYGFDPGHLRQEITSETDWFSYAQRKLSEYGGYCSIGVILLFIIYLPYKLIHICFGPCYPQEEWAKITKRTCLKRNRRQQTTAEKKAGKKKKFYQVNTQVTYTSQKDTVQTFGPQLPQHEELRTFETNDATLEPDLNSKQHPLGPQLPLHEKLRSFKTNDAAPESDLNSKQHPGNPEGQAPEYMSEPTPAPVKRILREVPKVPNRPPVLYTRVPVSYTKIYPDPRIWGSPVPEPKEGTWNVDEENLNK